MRILAVALAATLVPVLAANDAKAFDQPAHLAAQPELELAAGAPVRVQRTLRTGRPPQRAQRAWMRLAAEVGAGWVAQWDDAGGGPARAWGPGLTAPDTVADADLAARFARDFLARHLELLAPGASLDDFVIAGNDLSDGMRTVGFVQQRAGVPVIGGQLGFRFKADRLFMFGSEALPFVRSGTPGPSIAPDAARASAATWMQGAAAVAKPGAVVGPLVLPLIGETGVRDYRRVLEVTVDTRAPLGRWSVWVDAQSGAPVARKQTLRFANGTVLYNAPLRRPGAERLDFPALFAEQTVDGAVLTADAAGLVSWPTETTATVVATTSGSRVRVQNDAGPDASQTLSLAPGGTAIWNAANDEIIDSQISAFVHAHEVRDYAKGFAPALPWLNVKVQATVNINDVCNAFSDGSSINFFLSGSGCENTGRLADVVYHEFGHSLHANSIVQGVGEFESALSEGISDYLAATITGDSGMGRGFFFSNEPLREIDPPAGEAVWPDDISGDPHATGLIIAGALWDLRKALVEKLGEAPGVAQADHLYYEATRRAVDIPTMYAEVLAADDDDGDITNGTPNACEIAQTFGAHGLRSIEASIGDLSVSLPDVKGFDVSLTVDGFFPGCPGESVDSATLRWRPRTDPGAGGALPMSQAGSLLSGTIPSQADGTLVEYQVEVALGDGSVLVFPDNPADPYYQLFVGQVEELYCTKFDTDPAAEGWTHGLTAGVDEEGADDWQWDEPTGKAGSGDPTTAFSGDKVFGNDLGHDNFNGSYKPDRTNFGLSPVVDTTGKEVVRLQYRRWLNVEDAHFDHATIYADDQPVWANFDSMKGDEGSDVNHRDREWRFHDVDLSAQAADGSVQIKYEISSDPGLELGGWTLDDFCVVAWVASAPNPCFEHPELPECQEATGGAGGGGAGPGAGGAGGAGGDPPPRALDGGDGACGCSVPGDSGQASRATMLGLLALVGAAAHRRRRRARR
ncbi:MAG: MYXO-CTERM sorting domain-containing protein [Polyangiaceae bacterium]